MSVFKSVTIGQYYPGDSALHRLDPRFKIALAALYITALFVAQGWISYGLMLVISMTAIAVSTIPWRMIIRGLKPVLWILAFTMVIHIFTTKGGVVLWSWRSLSIHSEGVRQGIVMAVRLVLLILTTSLLTLTTSPIALTDGLERLLNPLRVIGLPAHELAMMMTIALRFIPTLIEEADKIMKAQMARGADFESGGLMDRAKSLIPLLVPLFISAFRRADELAMAMEARCYRGGENRTRMKQLVAQGRDWFALGIGFALVVVVIGLRLGHLDTWVW